MIYCREGHLTVVNFLGIAVFSALSGLVSVQPTHGER